MYNGIYEYADTQRTTSAYKFRRILTQYRRDAHLDFGARAERSIHRCAAMF